MNGQIRKEKFSQSAAYRSTTAVVMLLSGRQMTSCQSANLALHHFLDNQFG